MFHVKITDTRTDNNRPTTPWQDRQQEKKGKRVVDNLRVEREIATLAWAPRPQPIALFSALVQVALSTVTAA